MRVILFSPIVVAAFVLLGVALGFYLADATGLPRILLAATFSTVGLFVSLPIIVRIIDRLIANERRETA